MPNYRFDFVFSYWIFAWFLLYELKVINYNPFSALIFALFCNTIGLIGLIYYQYDWFDIIAFIIINFFIKVIPIISIKDKRIKKRDVFFTILLYCIFLLYIKVNHFPLKIRYKKPLDAPMVNWIRHFSSKKKL